MSQIAIRNDNEPRTSISNVAFGQGEAGGQIAPQNLGDILRFAEVMARADVAIPKHLRDNPGACLAVCMQAFNWEMNPFAVAQKSYKVNDIIAYEAQLIAAVINTRAGLKHRPTIEFDGEGLQRRCIVTFEASDGSTHVYRSPVTFSISPKNSPLWKTDPDQQLGYYSVRAGARRHFPEVLLGVYDRDELDGARDVTPATRSPSAFATSIAAQPLEQPRSAPEGFDRDFIDAELGARSGPHTDAADAIANDEPRSDDGFPGDAGGDVDPDAPAADHEIAIEGEAERRQADETASQPNHDPILRSLLTECASKFIEIAAGKGEGKERQDAIKAAIGPWKAELPNNLDDVRKIVDRVNAVVTGRMNLPAAVTMIATELGLREQDIRPVAR